MAQEAEFEAIPKAVEPLYHFTFAKWFYSDDPGRKRDVEQLTHLLTELQDAKPQVTSDPQQLLKAITLSEVAGTVAARLQSYGGLKSAINTEDENAGTLAADGEANFNTVSAETSLIKSAIATLTNETLDRFYSQSPELLKYRYFIEKARKAAEHFAPKEMEPALQLLASELDPFNRDFRNLLIKRSPDAIITVGGKELSVAHRDHFAELLRNDDREIRKQAFDRRLSVFRAQADLFGYGLLTKTKTANKLARLRNYQDGVEEQYAALELKPELVERLLKAFRDNASLTIRFQKCEAEYQRRLLNLAVAKAWDLDAAPKHLAPPRHTIEEASRSVKTAMALFGADYQHELEHLLDPVNGRLDIVPGINRDPEDFVWGTHGQNWVLFMHGYEGRTKDVITLAHESAHAVHYRLLHQNNVPYVYGDGARYFVEGCAKVNELLVLDTLAKQAKNDTERLHFVRESASKLASVRFASMYWAALATSFEHEVCKGIASGGITSIDEIHNVWDKYGRLWSIQFAEHPDLKYTWADTPHFFTSSRQYAQYLFAWVVALAFYEKAQVDPAAPEQFVGMMKQGFSDESGVLLKDKMGIDLADPDLIDRMFKVVESRVSDFEKATMAKE
jgi:oligoendopeptidase F